MANEHNLETQQNLSREINEARAQCIESLNMIERNFRDNINHEDVNEETLSYINRLRTELHNSPTTITTDDNLLTSQFLSEIKEQIRQWEEQAAYLGGRINDVDADIERIKQQISVAREARCGPQLQQVQRQVQQAHTDRAKLCFRELKAELHKIMHGMFPNQEQEIKELLGALMAEQLESGGYVTITQENCKLVEMLKNQKIVTTHPYDSKQVKLAYDA